MKIFLVIEFDQEYRCETLACCSTKEIAEEKIKEIIAALAKEYGDRVNPAVYSDEHSCWNYGCRSFSIEEYNLIAE